MLIFIPACFALTLFPGPNNLLAMRNAKQFSLATSVIAGSGRIIAFAVMIFLVASGLAVVLNASESLFLIIKVFGASYLFLMAYQTWTAKIVNTVDSDEKVGILNLCSQEFFLAAGNPKAILIFTAFLPQFVNPQHGIGAQFIVLGSLFLIMEWVAIFCYGLIGIYLRKWFSQAKNRRYFNQGSALLLGGAGLGILFTGRN